MFIFWGRKRQEEHIGNVADFCPICRVIRPFRLYAAKMVSHVYGLPVGRGEILGHQEACIECGIRLSVRHDVFTKTSWEFPPNLDHLISETFPNIHAAYRNRLEVENCLKNNPYGCSPNDRAILIREAFDILASLFESKCGGATEIDKWSGLALLLTIVAPILILILATNSTIGPKIDPYVTPAVWTAIIAGLSMTIYAFATAKDRFVQSRIMPLLIRSLYPLRPSAEEIDGALKSIHSKNFRLAGKLNAASILAGLDSEREAAVHEAADYRPISPTQPVPPQEKRTRSGKILAVCAGIIILFVVLVHVIQSDQPEQRRSRASAPREFKPSPNTQPKLPEMRLENGSLIQSKGLNGKGRLEIQNGLNHDAAAKLVNLEGTNCLAFFYVRSKSSHTLDGVPDGWYRVQFVTGNDWDANTRCFRRSPSCFEFEQQFQFTTKTEQKSDGKYTVTKTWSLTLHAVPQGKAKTRQISQAEFLKQ